MPAQHTAKIVIASAKRLIELRQLCLNSSRIAEISVPAWPIPIHQTKLIMAKPHAPGMVTPQMPTPFRNSHVNTVTTIVAMPPATSRPPNHPSGVCPVSTMPAIFCVTDRKLWPGAITAYSPVIGSIIGSTTGSCMGLLVAILSKLRVRVDDARGIRRAGTIVQVGEDRIIPLFGFPFGECAGRVVHVSEHDRVGRASLLARRNNLAIADRTVVLVGLDLYRLDPLYAVRAFLHHAARTHRHVRVAHELQALRVVVREQQEVEPPHLVWAVVRAVSRANATVIDHRVQAFGRMHRGAHRADLFAACVLAVLAGHRLEVRLGSMEVALEVRIDADPLHVAADLHLLAPHHRDIVLLSLIHISEP